MLIEPEKDLKLEGASEEVIEALKTDKLYIPDAYENFYLKRPTWGKIVSWGDKCKYKWEVGQKVAFARDGWAKLTFQNKEYLVFAESQLNATIG